MKVLKAIVRWALWLEPCGCGCDIIVVGPPGPYERREQFRDLGRIAKWATRDGSSD